MKNIASEWISINDRMPEMETQVLVYGTIHEQNDIYLAEYFVVNHYRDNELIDIKVEAWESLWGYEVENVTHWMPLPSPPGEYHSNEKKT